jgi:MFS family permease
VFTVERQPTGDCKSIHHTCLFFSLCSSTERILSFFACKGGYYGALVIFASGIGVLIGNIVGAVVRTVLTNEELVAWGWRLPFLSGILIGVVALLIQMFGEEHNPNESFYSENDETETSTAPDEAESSAYNDNPSLP